MGDGKQTTQAEKGYSFAEKDSNLTKVDFMIQWFFQLFFRPAIEIKITLLAGAPRLPARIASLSEFFSFARRQLPSLA